MKHHIATITVSAKKGDSQTSRWLVYQSIPYPSLTTTRGSLHWENAGKIINQYGHDAPILPKEYRAELLASNLEELPNSWNRLHLAGYKYCPKYGEPQVTNPGELVYRGRGLGELSAEMAFATYAPEGYVSFKVGYNSSLSPGDNAWLKEQVAPSLLAFTKDNAESLKAEAIAKIELHCAEKLAEVRKAIVACEIQIQGALSQL